MFNKFHTSRICKTLINYIAHLIAKQYLKCRIKTTIKTTIKTNNKNELIITIPDKTEPNLSPGLSMQLHSSDRTLTRKNVVSGTRK